MKVDMGKKILMLCYYFPPLLDVGCKRSVAFAKYLKRHGWNPIVLSVKNPDRNYCLLGREKPPVGVPTTYTKSLFNLSWIVGKINGFLFKIYKLFGISFKRNYIYELFIIPDIFMGWIPGAILSGYNLNRKYNVDYIYVSCTPYSSAIAGIALKKMTGKKLIIDFRDPMEIGLENISRRSNFRRKILLIIEKKIIDYSDIFIVNTEEVRHSYINKYPEIEYKTFTIYNGFDHELSPVEKRSKFPKFTIVYSGNMYFEVNQSKAFFEALAILKERKIINKHIFQFLYFGQNSNLINEIALELSITDLISARSTIPHKKMLSIISGSHLQLLRIIKPMISTKLFEGIAMNIPFLATIPGGEAESIIRKYSPSSHIITEESSELISKTILKVIKDYENGLIVDNYISQFIYKFSRENMTRKLEQIIEQKCTVN